MTPNRRLKQVRELRGWSQAKVAEQIGTDATTVSRWERGLFSPTPYFRERLCVLFGKNAEELGLMESEHPDAEDGQRAFSPRPAATWAVQQGHEGQPAPGSSTSTIVPPPAPSWPRRGDTFAYILDSAAHDQQAHTLWEDAYVRIMRGQRAEALQLVEASLNAFEHVGHPNAEAIREWLKRNELCVPSSSPTNTPTTAPLPPVAQPPDVKPPKRALKQMLNLRNIGLAVLLLAIVGIGIASLSLNQSSAPRVQAGVPASHSAPTQIPTRAASQSTGTAAATAPVSAAITASTSKHAKPTTPPAKPTTPPATSTPTSPALEFKFEPAALTPSVCQADSGYRCTLNITLYTNQPGTLNWQISSSNPAVIATPASGTSQPGSTFQIIVRTPNTPGQSSQLMVTVTVASHTYQQSVSWQD